jgi:hypothetical protein
MSSWATRNIPKKRDLSQIPEQFRPTTISRAAQPLVLQSESFQSKPIVNTNSTINDTKREAVVAVNPRQFVPKRVEYVSPPTAIELVHNDKKYVFVILRHIRTMRDNDLWISSYNSIRKFYTNKIIIIDDNSSINTVDGKLVNAEVIKSEFNGAGEILPYYYFLKYKWADRMVFLHDSMFLNRRFRDSELEGQIRFHWHFNSIDEIHNFTKIINLISFLKNNRELQAYVSDIDAKWYGCFGVASICSLDTLQYIEQEYNVFTSLVLSIKTRSDRESFERIFGIILYYEGIFTNDKCSNFGNIMKYPYAFEANNNFEGAANVLRDKGYDTAIIKVWRGR